MPDDQAAVAAAWLAVLPKDDRSALTGGASTVRAVVPPVTTAPAPDDPTQRIRIIDRQAGADYQLLEQLGSGGMGTVWLARQSGIARNVALKRMRRRSKEIDRHRFISEARITGGLCHPNIIPVYELGVDTDGRLFYTMRPVMGRTWAECIASLTIDENLEVLNRVAEAVAYAHSRGVLHRDLKPANMMLGDFGEVLVMDWGLACQMGTDDQKQSLVGTPAYMAPEMAQGRCDLISESGDVYQLGGMLLEILVGEAPHVADRTVAGCLTAAAANRLPRPSARLRNEYGELLSIAERALATDPGQRFASVADMIVALRMADRHRESLRLASRGLACLKRAHRSGHYEDFARSLFCLEESQALWGGNIQAHDAALEVRRDYAAQALERGDVDLAASLLHPQEPCHQALWERVQQVKNPQSG